MNRTGYPSGLSRVLTRRTSIHIFLSGLVADKRREGAGPKLVGQESKIRPASWPVRGLPGRAGRHASGAFFPRWDRPKTRLGEGKRDLRAGSAEFCAGVSERHPARASYGRLPDQSGRATARIEKIRRNTHRSARELKGNPQTLRRPQPGPSPSSGRETGDAFLECAARCRGRISNSAD